MDLPAAVGCVHREGGVFELELMRDAMDTHTLKLALDRARKVVAQRMRRRLRSAVLLLYSQIFAGPGPD